MPPSPNAFYIVQPGWSWKNKAKAEHYEEGLPIKSNLLVEKDELFEVITSPETDFNMEMPITRHKSYTCVL